MTLRMRIWALVLAAGLGMTGAAGAQTAGQMLLHAQVDTSGNVTVTPAVRAVFVWPAILATDVYLDGLTFSL